LVSCFIIKIRVDTKFKERASSSSNECFQVVIFAATRHHVEYLHLLLDTAEISNTFIYSQLDSTARKINAAKFSAKKSRILVVTDLAARGIDIPLLDNVVNYHFPAKYVPYILIVHILLA
jgi:superfamily II DNA/RNA helicase